MNFSLEFLFAVNKKASFKFWIDNEFTIKMRRHWFIRRYELSDKFPCDFSQNYSREKNKLPLTCFYPFFFIWKENFCIIYTRIFVMKWLHANMKVLSNQFQSKSLWNTHSQKKKKIIRIWYIFTFRNVAHVFVVLAVVAATAANILYSFCPIFSTLNKFDHWAYHNNIQSLTFKLWCVILHKELLTASYLYFIFAPFHFFFFFSSCWNYSNKTVSFEFHISIIRCR